MKLIFTKDLPNKEGYYYYTNFGEHTPCVLEVKKNYSDPDKALWASNEEFCFKIEKPGTQQELDLPEEKDEDEWKEKDGKDSYGYGDVLWCYIPNPCLPNTKREVEPNSY